MKRRMVMCVNGHIKEYMLILQYVPSMFIIIFRSLCALGAFANVRWAIAWLLVAGFETPVFGSYVD